MYHFIPSEYLGWAEYFFFFLMNEWFFMLYRNLLQIYTCKHIKCVCYNDCKLLCLKFILKSLRWGTTMWLVYMCCYSNWISVLGLWSYFVLCIELFRSYISFDLFIELYHWLVNFKMRLYGINGKENKYHWTNIKYNMVDYWVLKVLSQSKNSTMLDLFSSVFFVSHHQFHWYVIVINNGTTKYEFCPIFGT